MSFGGQLEIVLANYILANEQVIKNTARIMPTCFSSYSTFNCWSSCFVTHILI